MRGGILLATCVTTIACGRVGFDPRLGEADAPPAGPDADRADADADAEPVLAPIVFVQTAAEDFGSQASATLTLPAPVTAGNTIILAVDFDLPGSDAPELATVTDSLGTAYTITAAFDGSGLRGYLAYGHVAADGTPAIQLGASGSHFLFEVRLHEYSGIAALDPLDGTSAAFGASMAVDGAATPALAIPTAGELLFGFILFRSVGVAGTGFTTRSDAFADVTEDLVTPSPGMYSVTATLTEGVDWLAMAAAFHPAAQ